ncbi:MAG: Gfo/Idh/MocA family oxidoreductase, partial [Verrucomicrobiota bacterium]
PGQQLVVRLHPLCRGPEGWHPNPEFFYKAGAGPLFDMGPYYLTCFVNLLGPVSEVISMTKKSFSHRLITSQPKAGTLIEVDVPTHSISTLQFKSGAIGSLSTSFDVWGTKIPNIEVYGAEGTLLVPDPNTFGGSILFKSKNNKEWKEVAFTHSYSENWRGIGVADMALAMIQKRAHRAKPSQPSLGHLRRARIHRRPRVAGHRPRAPGPSRDGWC